MTSSKKTSFTFMTLEGSPLTFNPQERLSDYRAKHIPTGTGIVELQGKRVTQEDRIVVNELSEFAKLSEKQRKQVLLNTIKGVQDLVTTRQLDAGSTLCVTVLCGFQIYTASVGDSTAFIAVLDENGKMSQFFQLNRVLHNPGEPTEAKRLTKGNIFYGRLGGILALSRAIGDNSFESLGLLHEPDTIYIDEITIPKGGKAFVINACDGLTEADCLTQEDIIQILENNHSQETDIIALKLAESAFANGSQDNISVLVSPLEENTCKYLAVFDGHGGDEVSELLFQEFDRIFNRELESI